MPDVAAAHAAAIDAQIRVLRVQRAVLRAVARRASDPQEMQTMHQLADLSDEERRRIVAEFLDQVVRRASTSSPASRPGCAPRRRSSPTTRRPEQVEAWIELAELVRDDGFRASIRRMSEQHAAARRAERARRGRRGHARRRRAGGRARRAGPRGRRPARHARGRRGARRDRCRPSPAPATTRPTRPGAHAGRPPRDRHRRARRALLAAAGRSSTAGRPSRPRSRRGSGRSPRCAPDRRRRGGAAQRASSPTASAPSGAPQSSSEAGAGMP